MKAMLLLMSLVYSMSAFGQQTLDQQFTPFKTKVMKKLYKLDDISATADYAVLEGTFAQRTAKAIFDVATDTGTVGTKNLGVFLPAKALIKQVWFYTDTQFVDAGAGTVALQCEDAGNLFAAADVTAIAVGTVTSGVATGTAATMVRSIAATCELQAVVATIAQTAGKMTIFVEYVVHL